MKTNSTHPFLIKVIKGASSTTIILSLLAVASVTHAALTFTANNVTSDGVLVLDSTGTISVGTSTTATQIIIGRSTTTVSFPGVVSSSIIDSSGSLSLGTSTATLVTIGKSGIITAFPGIAAFAGGASSTVFTVTGQSSLASVSSTNLAASGQTTLVGVSSTNFMASGYGKVSGAFAIGGTSQYNQINVVGTASSSLATGFTLGPSGTTTSTATTSVAIAVSGLSIGDPCFAAVGTSTETNLVVAGCAVTTSSASAATTTVSFTYKGSDVTSYVVPTSSMVRVIVNHLNF